MANELSNIPQGGVMLGMDRHPVVQQLGLLVGIAAAVALGVVVVMWSRTPSYMQVYAGLSDKDTAMVTEGLAKSGIPYRVQAGGLIMVPAGKVADARMKLAAQGLPKGSENGFEMLQQEQGFGTSQFVENARYQNALETELARSISALSNVEKARVHLAIPKQSVFVRNRQPPTASVLLNLYPGRNLDDGQVAAIVHLVASSVPNLETARVTLIDQKGRLLNSSESSREGALNASQFDYTRKLEDSYVKRIEQLITPIIGLGGVRAQVVADLDFTVSEQTQEKFNPQQPALRSEQVAQELSSGNGVGGGVPGALSNQPPGGTVVPETTKPAAATPAKPGGAAPVAVAPPVPSNSSNRATRNYELDKVISHTRQASGGIKRLSVAVLVDDKQTANEDGELVRTPLKPEELEKITGLIKEAVGFDEKRGDSLNVINAPFSAPPAIEALPEPPLWKEAWVWEVGKQALAGLLVIFLLFRVLLPVVRGLLGRQAASVAAQSQLLALQPARAHSPGMPAVLGGGGNAALGGPTDYDTQLNAARSLTSQDPKRVAQVVKTWVASDG